MSIGFDPITLLTFVSAGVALNLTPGVDMMFCLAQGMRGGPRPGVAAAGGISVGAMVNVVLAGAGLGALVAAYPAIFDLIRWGGAAYLLVLAWNTLRAPLSIGEAAVTRPARAFGDAVVVNLTNPKVILFILAFLPQFVDPARGSVFVQFLILGGLFSTTGFVVNGLVGYFAGGLGHRLARSRMFERGLRAVSASVFGLLALKLIMEGRTA